MWSVHTTERLQPEKEVPRPTWVNLEDTTLSEVSQSQKDKYGVISLTRGPWTSRIHRDRTQKGGVGARGWGWGVGRECVKGTEFHSEKMENVLEMDSADGCACVNVLTSLSRVLRRG